MDELQKLRLTNSEIIKENIRLSSELTLLKIDRFKRFSNEECWIYDEGGDNHLESLTCPVVVKASTLVKLIRRNFECVK